MLNTDNHPIPYCKDEAFSRAPFLEGTRLIDALAHSFSPCPACVKKMPTALSDLIYAQWPEDELPRALRPLSQATRRIGA